MDNPLAKRASMMRIDVAKDFSPFPIGRFTPRDGEYTGQSFRELHLVPAMKSVLGTSERIYVDIEGLITLGSSFLEEAFGGLVRESGFKRSDVEKYIVIEFKDPSLKFYSDEISKYIREA
ncbi:STAS-like domain-containing protein [Paracoccus litorisediminis]|uniref:DUF4325 domain-containing protein n=1 Tax=Paracoccus litorisediminis TaxID=2006130 RepID=A0A844HT08_9RHOB|nr:STAS-like domain-containing protein [Paracoccus litorisediminis]MTH60672.1 DUF4325 domain-containing protein [Paracoccus litorisediminis]